MNEIGFALGSFCGGLFIGAISWKLGAWLGEERRCHCVPGCRYANTRDDTPSTWGAWIAFVLMLVNHWSTKPTDEQ